MERVRQARRRRREYETTWTVLDEQMMQRARDLARDRMNEAGITNIKTDRGRLRELLDWARATPASDPSFRTIGLIAASGASLAVLAGVIGWAAIVTTNPVALATATIVALLAAGVTFGTLHRWLQP